MNNWILKLKLSVGQQVDSRNQESGESDWLLSTIMSASSFSLHSLPAGGKDSCTWCVDGITAHVTELGAVNLMQQDWIPGIWLLGLRYLT